MRYHSIVILFFLICFVGSIHAQLTNIQGTVTDKTTQQPIAAATISVQYANKKAIANNDGFFSIKVQANKNVNLVISAVGYRNFVQKVNGSVNAIQIVNIQLQKTTAVLDTVAVKNTSAERREVGRVSIDASKAIVNPSPIGGIESLIKIFVGSNNELTSQYSVRGGSYDENLIYVNDFEVFRPYLVRNGQQEGLSFINPELTSGVKFYNGGFQAKYGDKMSSVLDITYKKPKQFGGSAYLGLLEQGVHIEGVGTKNKLSYVLGVRNRTNRNLLASQATRGNYIPSSNDIQALVTYQLSNKWQLEALANFSATRFTLFPEESKLTSAVFTNSFSANLGLDIFFAGSEKSKYSTQFIGASATHQPNKNVRLKFMVSSFTNIEQENIDITAAYLFGERDFDRSRASYGLIVNPLGAGAFLNYARNNLTINVLNASHKGSMDKGKHFIQWGATIEQQTINDKLNEWQYNDSAGYSLPFNPAQLNLFSVLKSNATINITRLHGYLQDNIQFKNNNDVIAQVGVRYNYNSLNNQLLISPRVAVSFKPRNTLKDIVYKAAIGTYHQPPFYRELRRYDGTVNTQLKAQQSFQVSAGVDYNFKMFKRPARITSELYYKNMWNVVPYDVDNVRVRYFGENNAVAYAAGFETRLYGELVKDAESWISLGIMQTKERISNFNYFTYKNAAGETIGASTIDQVIVDSVSNTVGYVRRPTDRLVTFGMFFQDYMPNNKNLKFYMSAIYGSNLPYNIPNSVRFRNALTIESYIRLDMGFSAMLLDGQKQSRRSHSPFKSFESIWASLEVFNVIDRANTISYLLIKDFQNNTFTMPNRLTPRLINLKLVARW